MSKKAIRATETKETEVKVTKADYEKALNEFSALISDKNKGYRLPKRIDEKKLLKAVEKKSVSFIFDKLRLENGFTITLSELFAIYFKAHNTAGKTFDRSAFMNTSDLLTVLHYSYYLCTKENGNKLFFKLECSKSGKNFLVKTVEYIPNLTSFDKPEVAPEKEEKESTGKEGEESNLTTIDLLREALDLATTAQEKDIIQKCIEGLQALYTANTAKVTKKRSA